MHNPECSEQARDDGRQSKIDIVDLFQFKGKFSFWFISIL